MPNYRLKAAEPVDLPWMRLLFSRWYAENPYPYPAMDDEEFDNFIVYVAKQLANPRFYCTLGVIGHRVVGFLCGAIVDRAFGKPRTFFYANWLYIVPNHRHSTLAQQLILDCETWTKERGVTEVEVVESYESKGMWPAKGFTPFTTNYHMTFADGAAKLTAHPKLAVAR